ncbi:MAG: phosphoglycerate dehydrogenase [Candidatus Omnitrophota bacterium]|nr:phosphoglycerate dehydrogenase [Candidatus Omnitrophota bacterium]MBU1894592.1 phosphoglycerate dehydrogenase [Candidatus Omnitrophota bacterium]
MKKILKLNKISKEGLNIFPLDEYEIGTEISIPDAIILRSYDMHNMELPASLLAIARAGSGVNNIPVNECSEKGIVVFNTPGANANAVKELTIAGLLLATRNIVEGIEFAKSLKGKGDKVPALVEAGKKNYAGQELYGKKIGIIGLGKIGVMVANKAVALGMQVSGYDPFISIESAWGLSREVKRTEGLDSLLAGSDYLSIHTPLINETRGMINEARFKNMKKGIRILNFSRGGIVNNDDLKNAIKAGIVDRYVTDFPDDEVLNMDKVIAIPHLGASTEEAEVNCAVMAATQIKDFLEKGTIKNSVNYMDCHLDQNSNFRLIIMNKNIPNMVGQISAILANANINIIEMLNKSKGNYAYSIIDIEEELSKETIDAIYRIDGVIKVRSLNLKFN